MNVIDDPINDLDIFPSGIDRQQKPARMNKKCQISSARAKLNARFNKKALKRA